MVFQRNRIIVCTRREKGVYFKDVAHTVVGADKSEICRVGQQIGDSEKR